MIAKSARPLTRRYHDLRYVLKNKKTNEVFFVVVFTLVLKEDVEKEEAEEGNKEGSKAESKDGEQGNRQTSSDDLD